MSNIALITTLLERTIAYHPVFRDVAGSTVGGLFLSQAYYWSTGGRIASERAGWFYKTGAEWLQETRLSRSEQERARRDLKKVGLLEERRRGNPAKMYFRLNLERLFALIEDQAAGKVAQKKPKKINSVQDSAITVQTEEKTNENNSMQDSAVMPEPEQVRPAISEENPIETTDCRIPQTRVQNPANKNAESCNLNNTESTTENTSEITPNSSTHADENVFDQSDQVDQDKAVGRFEKFPMSPEWQPGDVLVGLCKTRGVVLKKFTAQEFDDVLREFRTYRQGEGLQLTQHKWEVKLVDQLMWTQRNKQNTESGYASKSNNSGKSRSGAAALSAVCGGSNRA